MTLQEKLENAARVMGLTLYWPKGTLLPWLQQPPYTADTPLHWIPHLDDGDSRRLEIALRKHCSDHPRPFDAWPLHIQELWGRYGNAADSGDAEQYRAAVLDLAAAIGEVINAA